jgi:hypothetical protein
MIAEAKEAIRREQEAQRHPQAADGQLEDADIIGQNAGNDEHMWEDCFEGGANAMDGVADTQDRYSFVRWSQLLILFHY